VTKSEKSVKEDIDWSKVKDLYDDDEVLKEMGE
jgi:hypothetical protein